MSYGRSLLSAVTGAAAGLVLWLNAPVRAEPAPQPPIWTAPDIDSLPDDARSVWARLDPPEQGRRALKHRLVEEMMLPLGRSRRKGRALGERRAHHGGGSAFHVAGGNLLWRKAGRAHSDAPRWTLGVGEEAWWVVGFVQSPRTPA